MDLEYFRKIQGANGIRSKRDMQLAKTNRNMSKHFNDTYDTEVVLVGGRSMEVMFEHDTSKNTFMRKIKTKHGDMFNLGEYIIWNDQVWIVGLVDYDDKTWNRGYIYLCTILLRWQNKNGEIVQRWAYNQDFTKYASGEDGNSYITVGDNQYGLMMPIDEETKHTLQGTRFAVDLEGVDPPNVYELTNRKILLTDGRYFGRGGIITWVLSFKQFNELTDKKVDLGDGEFAWICDYVDPTAENETNSNEPTVQTQMLLARSVDPNTTCTIEHLGKPRIIIGKKYKTFTAKFIGANGDSIDSIVAKWRLVTSDDSINEKIHYQIGDNNTIKIKADFSDALIGQKLKLIASNQNESVSTSIYIDIGGGI